VCSSDLGGGGGSSNSSDRGEDRGSGKTEAEEQNNHVEIVLKEETRKETAIVQKKPKRTVCQRKTLRVFSTLCIVFPPLVLLALTGTLLGGIMCNFQSNVDAFGVLLVDANTSVGLVSSGTSGSGNGGNCTVTTTTTTTTTTMTTTGSSTTTSSVTSYNVVDSPTMCQALNSSSDGATISGSPPGLMCNGMVMVGWLPDLWASLGEEQQQQATSSNTTTTNSASSSTWGLTNTNVIAPSIPLAFLIMIEHMINVNLYAGLIHDHPSVDNNLELFALGTTNIVASLFS
jgi:hypothetical protein